MLLLTVDEFSHRSRLSGTLVIFQSVDYLMNKSSKAVSLSAFVFPGAGHFFLKKHAVGAILAGAAMTTLYLIGATVIVRAQQIAQQIQSGEVPLDIAAIAQLLSGQTTGIETQSLNLATAVFTVTWLVGIVDSYRIARQKDDA